MAGAGEPGVPAGAGGGGGGGVHRGAAGGGGGGGGARGGGDAEEVGRLYSNRSAARLARGDAAGALADAQAARDVRPDWGKPCLREAAAREALGGPFWGPAALEAALAAQEREPSASSRQTVVRLTLKAATRVRLKEGAPPLLPGTVPCAGDIEALCWTGDSVGRVLRRCYQSEDRWVKCAALLQLAVLAAAPEHKAFFAAGGIEVFADCAVAEDLDACFPPRGSLADACPDFPKAVHSALDRHYEAMHPLAICALGYANFLRYSEYCPGVDAAGCMLARSQHLRALGKIASEAQMCTLSVGLLGQALRAVTAAVEAGGKTAILAALEGGMPETVERMTRACREMDMAIEERALQRLYHKIWKHPDHPDNQVEAA